MSSDTPIQRWTIPDTEGFHENKWGEWVLARDIAKLERELAELRQSLLTREEGGEWVSRCDHEDEIAELLWRKVPSPANEADSFTIEDIKEAIRIVRDRKGRGGK